MNKTIFVSKRGTTRMQILDDEFTINFDDGSSVSFPFKSCYEFVNCLDEQNETIKNLCEENKRKLKSEEDLNNKISELEAKLYVEKNKSKEFLHNLTESSKEKSEINKEIYELKKENLDLNSSFKHILESEKELRTEASDSKMKLMRLRSMSFIQRLKFAFTGEL